MSLIAISRVLKSGTTIGIALVAAFLASCGGGSAVVSPAAAPAALPAAIATGCIYPATASQTVTLPSAGGMSGTISLAPFAQASNTCVGVTIATGSDATLTGTSSPSPDAAARRSALAATPLPKPFAQVELTNAFSGTMTPLTISLDVPASVPDGHYPATITTTIDLGDGQPSTSVANFTLTVVGGKAVLTGPTLPQALAVINADTSGLLSMYPAGTVLATPSPAPVESESPSPMPTATATATATATPTTKPTPTPAPTPASTATPTGSASPSYTISLSPSGCTQFGSTSSSATFTATISGPPIAQTIPGSTLVAAYGWQIQQLNADWSLTIPQPATISTSGGAISVGSMPSVTVTSPTFPDGGGSLYGDGATINVYAVWVVANTLGTPAYNTYGYGFLYGPNGVPASASVTVVGGLSTCPAAGSAEARSPLRANP